MSRLIYPGSDLYIYYTFSKRSYSKICVKWPLSKRPKIGFQDQISLNAGQKYYRMLQVEHSALLRPAIRCELLLRSFCLSFFEWPFYTGFTVYHFGK